MFTINKASKVIFYHTVLPLSLAVGLRLEGGREPPFDTQKVAQGGPELGREYWASVADNRLGETLVSNYNIEDNFC